MEKNMPVILIFFSVSFVQNDVFDSVIPMCLLKRRICRTVLNKKCYFLPIQDKVHIL